MKTFLFAAGAAAAIAWAAPALSQPAAIGSKPMTGMARGDIDQRVQRHFARLDANRDGFITQAEMQSLAAQRPKRRDPAAAFARLDANGDGQITRAEADAAHAARARARAGAHGGMFERADANRDGVISRSEFDAAPAHRGGRRTGADRPHALGARMFAIADTDRDGRVSLAEATALAMGHFNSADANRDGIISADERRQMRQHRRGAAPNR